MLLCFPIQNVGERFGQTSRPRHSLWSTVPMQYDCKNNRQRAADELSRDGSGCHQKQSAATIPGAAISAPTTAVLGAI
jgi:hypothetical protein